jgi:pimeloyl-ACP methyl ester carboxylesterase
MSGRLSGFPGVLDTHVVVGGRPVRTLRADGGTTQGAEPQLLVHGLGGSSVTWVEVMAGLAEHGPVAAVDLPGFGRTPPGPDDPLTVPGYVELVMAAADALGWERFTLHGNSMGGLIALLLAARHPERVSGLVLVSPALPPRLPIGLLVPARATVQGMLPIVSSSLRAGALGALGLAGPELSQRRARELLKLIYADPDAVDRRTLALMAEDFTSGAIEGSERRRALLTAVGSIARIWADPRGAWRAIARVEAPTLLIGGTKDALVPARVLRAVLARRRDWEGHVLDDRRHALMLEEPDAYLDLVHRWRARRDGAAA